MAVCFGLWRNTPGLVRQCYVGHGNSTKSTNNVGFDLFDEPPPTVVSTVQLAEANVIRVVGANIDFQGDYGANQTLVEHSVIRTDGDFSSNMIAVESSTFTQQSGTMRVTDLTLSTSVYQLDGGVLDLPIALGAVVVLYATFRIVPPERLYDAVEWPVIVLIGSLIPIAEALEASGGTAKIAGALVGWTGWLPPWALLGLLMVMTMTLSDVLNNVATALIAAPIAVDIAGRLDASPDPFLMAVAVASSCAFLTPIGHKNNTIILGPGGYSFGDYWRMGLPLEVLVVLVAVPMILVVWPL